MGRFNSSRERYAAAFKQKRELDAWMAEWKAEGNYVCDVHSESPYPRRDDYGTVHEFLAAVERWGDVGDEERPCSFCVGPWREIK